MNAEFELALRQQRLQLRSAALRRQLGEQAVVLEAPFNAADRVQAAALWLYRQRAWLVGGAVVVVVVRPRKAWALVKFSWWLWRSVRRVQSWLPDAGLPAASGR